MKTMRRIITCIFAVAVSAIAFAQNEGEITGKVIDADTKAAVPFAFMQLTSAGKMVMQTESDLDGLYTFKPVNPGTYALEVRYIGAGSKVFTNIVVESRGLTYLECSISASASMDTLIIRAPLVDRNDPEIKITFDEKMIGDMPVTNIADVAVLAPAVQPNEQSGGLFLGGSREDATLYVVDGVKVIGSVYVPMNAVKSVSVLTGGIPARYGDVTGGIIEVTTKGYAGIY